MNGTFLFGWRWLVAGADLLPEKSTVFLVARADLV